MNVMSNTTAKRYQRVTAPLRRIQGQVAAIERFLVEDPDGNPPLPTAAVGIGVSISSPRISAWLTSEHQTTIGSALFLDNGQTGQNCNAGRRIMVWWHGGHRP
jgi:hypothetical protein